MMEMHKKVKPFDKEDIPRKKLNQGDLKSFPQDFFYLNQNLEIY